jgi:hypothetical protein
MNVMIEAAEERITGNIFNAVIEIKAKYQLTNRPITPVLCSIVFIGGYGLKLVNFFLIFKYHNIKSSG